MVLVFERKDGSLFALSDVHDFCILFDGYEIVHLDGSTRFVDSSLCFLVSGSL